MARQGKVLNLRRPSGPQKEIWGREEGGDRGRRYTRSDCQHAPIAGLLRQRILHKLYPLSTDDFTVLEVGNLHGSALSLVRSLESMMEP